MFDKIPFMERKRTLNVSNESIDDAEAGEDRCTAMCRSSSKDEAQWRAAVH